jgi:nitrogen regulatory protein PII
MKLLVYVLNQPDKLDELLAGYVELGIPGATIVDSVGMARVLSESVPLFAGFQALREDSSSANRIILAVIREQDKVAQVRALVEELCGPIEAPGGGLLFTLPVEDVHGLRDA